MKKQVLLAICLLPMLVTAQQYAVLDTLWVNADRDSVARDEATGFGIVRSIDSTANVAIIHYFNRETQRLESIQRVVAQGQGMGLEKGKQLFFDDEGKVKAMNFYTIVRDPKNDKVLNRLANETFLYPDGKTQEEVIFSYGDKPNQRRTYVRKIYSPEGFLQYEETMNDKGEQTTTYFKPNGKKDKHPKVHFDLLETLPVFPGGFQALIQFLSNNVKYPPIAQENGIQGRTIVQFVVNKDGSICDIVVVRSAGDPSLDREAIRVVKSMPRWKPGTHRGKPIRVKYTLPVNFKLK